MANKWLTELMKIDNAVNLRESQNIYNYGIRSPSPSVNFIFGNTHLLPFGYSAIFWGPPKGGKSILCNAIAGQLHRDDPDAIVVKFNTELREEGQMNERVAAEFGIDLDRYIAYNTNRPAGIFDVIEHKIEDLCQRGAKIKLVIIDSITDIAGRRSLNSDSVDNQQIGDEAATIQAGLKRIRETIRRNKIALIMTAHARAELDQAEIRKHRTIKMAGAYYLKHFAEYFVFIAPNDSAEGRKDISGNEFKDESRKDLAGHEEQTAHKIRVMMNASSVGVKGRTGEFTLDYYQGIINIQEEVFRLGLARGVIDKPNQQSYALSDYPKEGETSTWRGKENCLTALRNNEDLQKEIIRRIKTEDIELFKTGKKTDKPIIRDEDTDLGEMPFELVEE